VEISVNNSDCCSHLFIHCSLYAAGMSHLKKNACGFDAMPNYTATGSGIPRKFSGGVQQIQLRTEDREDGDLGAVAP